MKMANKVLSVVLAVVMIAALSAMAFAAAPAYTYTVGEVKDGKVEVTVVFSDCIGLASGDIFFDYDANVTTIAKKSGKDLKAIGDVDNALSNDFNKAFAENQAKLGYYFKENLWDSDTWAAADGADEEVNGEAFQAFVLTFTLADATKGTTVKAHGTAKFKDGTEVAMEKDIVLVEAAVIVTTTEADVVTTTEADVVTTTEADVVTTTTADDVTTTKADDVTTTVKSGKDDKPMGDNGVLAIVAGVCALAGAAFVVTKKRK